MNEECGERLGWAWVALCGAFGLHIVDEASTGFLSVYNPTAMELRRLFPFIPAPTFEFREWLVGLVAADAILFGLSPLAFQNNRFVMYLACPFVGIMFANGVGHIAGTIAGRTVKSVRFARPMPGFWSSPLILVASAYLANEIYRNRANGERRGRT
jgi:hypothetical protein